MQARKKKERKPWTPQVYYVELEPPTVIEVGSSRYECKKVVESPSGLLCIQYDGTAVLIQQKPQHPVVAQL